MIRSSLTHYPQGKRPGKLLFGRSDDVILGNGRSSRSGTRAVQPAALTWVKTADEIPGRLAS